ncbi:Rab5 GDP/GTP exchange factor, partial [Operophtera brumata]
RFMKHMDSSHHFANVDSDMKERLMDFVEKHAMTYLHDLPSVVFSPSGTGDEREDRAMSERIQQLSWVCERRLDCKLDRDSARCRQLLYKAISAGPGQRALPAAALQGYKRYVMYEREDRAMSERIQQLSWVCERRLDCKLDRDSARCRQLLYKAISELLGMDSAPSPGGKLARVRRCCRHVLALCGAPASADDLLPALIFTCCAVSFIDNLNAESLSMEKKEFDCYMAMPASIGGSAWKVQDVLTKTPLEIKPRRELPRIGKLKGISTAPLVDLEASAETPTSLSNQETSPTSLSNQETQPTLDTKPEETAQNPPTVIAQPQTIPEIPIHIRKVSIPQETEQKLNILGFEVIEKDSPTKSPPNWDLKQTNSLELLTPSPLGFTPFDSRSIDELMTPDEFGADILAPGLSNINYDIDLSDFSGDNSLAEDAPKSPKTKDPFSPDGIKKFDPFAPQTSGEFSKALETFDEFSLESKVGSSDPFEVVHRIRDPFSPVEMTVNLESDPFSPQQKVPSILDDTDSPTSACLLPSPIQPGKPT